MYHIHQLNKISAKGTELLTADYMNTDCAEDAEYLASRIRETMGVKDIVIGYVGPVIGAHSGPGTMALFFLGKER